MKVYRFYWLCILIFLISPLFAQEIEGARSGRFDASTFLGEKDWMTSLDGQWEFYWQTFLDPEDFCAETAEETREYITLPGNWNLVNEYPSHGYATMGLRVTGLEENKVYSLYIPEMLTSFRMYINGKQVFSNGQIGRQRRETKAQFLPGIVFFSTVDGNAEILCQISNFDHRNSGVWRSLSLGTEQYVLQDRKLNILTEMFLAGVLLTISLFHIGIYIYRRKSGTELLFGLSCLILFFRTITTGEQLINQLLPNFPWELARKLEYSPFYVAAPLFMTFITNLFPEETVKKINNILLAFYILLGGFFIIFPVRITNHAILPAQLLMVVSILYVLVVLIRALAKGRAYSIHIISAFIILALAVVNDILFSNQIIHTRYLAPQGFILFIIIQSQMLSRRYARSFSDVENLSHKLRNINDSLSRFVPFQFLEYLKKESILDVNLGDQVLEDMTILFADIRSFTSLSEVMTPEENFKFLNSFLSQVVPVIRQQGGFVDKFIGDAIMALFPSPPDQAVKAAIELQKAVNLYNQARGRAGYRTINLGIGIHTGQLMLGTIGESNRMETTVISDTVNTASRLEDLTKTYGSRIIISRHVLNKLKSPENLTYRSLGRADVKGRSESVEIIELLDVTRGGSDSLKYEHKEDFEKGLTLLEKEEYSEAEKLFERLIAIDPDDQAAAHLLKCSRNR